MQQQHLQQLKANIQQWAQDFGFQQVGFSGTDLSKHEHKLEQWLAKGFHGDMDYMAKHGSKRSRPHELEPGTQTVISLRMDYLPPDASFAKTLKNTQSANISRYAVGRDYHKLMRKRLAQLAKKIAEEIAPFQHRVFVDSAPVLERALAENSGIGWIGKNTMLINPKAGSWFFLGEIYTDIPFDSELFDADVIGDNCGQCQACLSLCPTQAIVAPYQVDARRCISYLTIEHKGAIDESLRPLMGNRIYGCDDCQLVCPWNRYSQLTQESDFHFRQFWRGASLLELFSWDEATFLKNTEGSPIRRIGYQSWQRNLAIALGNADYDKRIVSALQAKLTTATELVKEHIDWAINQQNKNSSIPIKLINTVEKMHPRDA